MMNNNICFAVLASSVIIAVGMNTAAKNVGLNVYKNKTQLIKDLCLAQSKSVSSYESCVTNLTVKTLKL